MEQKIERVCPWWLGYFLLIPIRKWGQNPDKILASRVKPGMNVLDFGCAMGYFSLPLARLVGVKGNVYCVDIQEKMLRKLRNRADKAGIGEVIKTRLVGKN
jgi:ubiquinone/menaquinone biosynthesis C-methylase UbiE